VILTAAALLGVVYVGTQHELPDPPFPQYLDTRTGATGALKSPQPMQPCKVEEERRVVRYDGVLGVSLYYAGNAPRTTVILIHGADAETRQMGWIVPYFACNGVNVISYDQRGTGESTGNWLANGPPDRARDVDAIYDAFRGDAHVDPRRIGVWGFSNGGWTAPIVAVDRPLAFMILQSAAAESVEENTLYEVRQAMVSAGHNDADIARAIATWQAVIGAVDGHVAVSTAKKLYAQAKQKTWFNDSLLPIFPIQTGFTEPALSGWRRYVTYDPAATLVKVQTPTLALYGRRDTKVDTRHDVPILVADFRTAGMRDLTVHWFADAGHAMKVTANGFDNARPVRYTRGYPEVMLDWLVKRNLVDEKR
jgi:hypothetical protein